MAGQSKWSSVRRFKGVSDTKRGQLPSKLSQEILVAANVGAEAMSSDEEYLSITAPHFLQEKHLANGVRARLAA